MTPPCTLISGRFVLGFMLGLACFLAGPSTAYAKKKPNYGSIKILTTPAGLPLEIDGKPLGQTTVTYRELELAPGIHTIVFSLPNGQRWSREVEVLAGRKKCITLNYKPRTIAISKSPCPYPVNVSAPTRVNDGDLITFSADVGYSGPAGLKYSWTVSPSGAKILNGAGTPTITVDSTGLAGRPITARLIVDNGSGDSICRQSSQASAFVPPLPSRASPAKEFDVCHNCSFDDQKARLDNLGIELQNDPSLTAYIITYGGRTSPILETNRLGVRAKDYLVTGRRIDPSRIVVINGGLQEQSDVELWIVPRGAKPPRPKPMVQAGNLKPTQNPSKAKPTSRLKSH
jgi:PEGA domain-containing protein